jgi:hypothetical protein
MRRDVGGSVLAQTRRPGDVDTPDRSAGQVQAVQESGRLVADDSATGESMTQFKSLDAVALMVIGLGPGVTEGVAASTQTQQLPGTHHGADLCRPDVALEKDRAIDPGLTSSDHGSEGPEQAPARSSFCADCGQLEPCGQRTSGTARSRASLFGP